MAGTTLPLALEGFQGRQLGKYEVLCRLSTGGMAEIFLASLRGLGGFRKLVVLKQILPDIRGEEEFVRMFLDEAKVTGAFNQPHIAQVYDLDVAEGELFLAMEFVPGATLVEVARAVRGVNESIPMGFSLMAVRDTAVALHYAHTFTDPLGHPSPVIHRDIAEKNIMVTYEGVTKLLDFGIAKSLASASRTAVGMVKGTSGYMSPEQVLGEPLDARSDLFSLGVVLHECLTGMRLFYAKQADAMLNAVLRCEVTAPSRINRAVPPELDAIVLKALSKRREDRYATTLEFARALERAVGPLIWHPEQSSELMRRLFADRREQTRQLLASGTPIEGGETSVVQRLTQGSVESPEPGSTSGRPPTARPAAATKSAPPSRPPAPRRPTASVDAAAHQAVLSPPGKRVRPPAQPVEAPPPPQPTPESLARTQPNTPALSSEQPQRPPGNGAGASGHREGETVFAPRPRAATREVISAEPPPPPRSSRSLTSDSVRVAAPPEPRSDHTAVVRLPSSPSGELSAESPSGLRRPAPKRRPTTPVEAASESSSGRITEPMRPQSRYAVEEAEQAPPPATSSPRSHTHARIQVPRPPPPRRSPWLIVGGVGVALLVLGGVALGMGGDASHEAPPEAIAPPTSRVAQKPARTPAPADDSAAHPTPPDAPIPETPTAVAVVATAAQAAPAQATPTEAPPAAESAPVEAAPAEPVAEAEPRTAKKPRSPVRRAKARDSEPAADPNAPPGFLTLVTEPPATVYLSGRALGETPLFKLSLPAGKHSLKLVNGGGRPLKLAVEIKSGDTTAVRVPLGMLEAQ
ncbi:serine/threonine protein kinase [Corallococcus sp. H22C18031201]|nr:serine/threonine protein kinase [Corallococcus sp. H22C18031201]